MGKIDSTGDISCPLISSPCMLANPGLGFCGGYHEIFVVPCIWPTVSVVWNE